eukprot:1192706-Prorocentrum_minimum.AAC.4
MSQLVNMLTNRPVWERTVCYTESHDQRSASFVAPCCWRAALATNEAGRQHVMHPICADTRGCVCALWMGHAVGVGGGAVDGVCDDGCGDVRGHEL